MTPRRALALAAFCAALTSAAPAAANPAGKSTLQETIRKGTGAFRPLLKGPGEPYLVRTAGMGRASARRTATRRSMISFAQLTDPQTGQPGTPPLPAPFPRTGQGGEPRLSLPDAITGTPGDPRYPYREPLPAPPPGGPPRDR